MKIFQAAPNTLKTVQKVFKFTGSGARGPAGTISSLNTLDEKAVVVAADLTITGDSADSFNNKKSTWQQIIDSVLSVFILKTSIGVTVQAFAAVLQATTASFTTALLNKLNGIEAFAEANNISDVNATALTDGGETAIHSHAGGGGEWSDVLASFTYTVAVANVNFLDVFTDDYEEYLVEFFDFGTVSASVEFPAIRFGYGAVPTWIVDANHGYAVESFNSFASSNTFDKSTTATMLRIGTTLAGSRYYDLAVKIRKTRDITLNPKIEVRGTRNGQTNESSTIISGSGVHDGDDINKIDHFQVISSAGGTISNGFIRVRGRNVTT